MEVQRINKTSVSRIGFKEPVPKGSIPFQSVIDQKKTDLTLESLNKKMQEIETSGNQLVESRTIENLVKYKKLVKEFMNDVVKNGLQLQEQHSFNHYGSSKIYKLVKEVDKKLVDVTSAALDKQQQGLDLLNLLGEIKGMLMDLYI